MVCARCKQRAAAADGLISWLARGDFGGLRALARLGGQSELGAAASRKAVWCDLRLASLLTHLFLVQSGFPPCFRICFPSFILSLSAEEGTFFFS